MNEGNLKPFKKGQSGNPKGRPKGSRNKLSESFLKDALEAWEKDGKTALKTMASEKPADFAKMIASIIPKEGNIELHANLPITKIERVIIDPTTKTEQGQ